MKKIRNIGFSLEELQQLEEELVQGVLDSSKGGERERLRVSRIVRNKIRFCQAVVASQNWLEQKGLIEVI